eukprot:4090485-Pleurochrysis_carterae.AAC.2
MTHLLVGEPILAEACGNCKALRARLLESFALSILQGTHVRSRRRGGMGAQFTHDGASAGSCIIEASGSKGSQRKPLPTRPFGPNKMPNLA